MRLTALLVVVAGLATAAPGPDKKAPAPRSVEGELALPHLGLPRGPGIKLAVASLGEKYLDKGEPVAALRKAVRDAQAALWASTAATPPRELADAVAAMRKRMRIAPAALITEVVAPKASPMEKRLKDGLMETNRSLARVVAVLEQVLEDLQSQAEAREKENLRWQAHHQAMTAAVTLRLVHLGEYGLALGSMRKEFPDRDATKQRGWRMEPVESLRDAPGKKMNKAAKKSLEAIQADHADTVWAQAAKQMQETPLGVEWKAQ
ncbi:MAG: hypothetical protein K2W96_08260 [Gemmataceae bacterium]|nr:hypothetical protein [Gemmataceae bacterium]